MEEYLQDERATHLSLDGIRTNGQIIDVHNDNGFIYYTLALDDGREVQTLSNRLKKGEYTGIGSWQRVLDQQTTCYFFFDDETEETHWDTPEARERIGLEQEEEEEEEEEEEGNRYANEYSQPQSFHPPPPLPVSSPMTKEQFNHRARVISQSPEFRQALVNTGSESIERNLQTLGIATGHHHNHDVHSLAQILAMAISKVSLTLEEEDLFLLLQHCMGGRLETILLSRALSSHEESKLLLQYVAPTVVSGEERKDTSFDRPPSRAPPSHPTTDSNNRRSKDFPRTSSSKRSFAEGEAYTARHSSSSHIPRPSSYRSQYDRDRERELEEEEAERIRRREERYYQEKVEERRRREREEEAEEEYYYQQRRRQEEEELADLKVFDSSPPESPKQPMPVAKAEPPPPVVVATPSEAKYFPADTTSTTQVEKDPSSSVPPPPSELQDSLSALTSDLDKLMENLGKAGDRIDDEWKPQHGEAQSQLQELKHLEDLEKEGPPPPLPPPKQLSQPQMQQRMAPPPRAACGICSVM